MIVKIVDRQAIKDSWGSPGLYTVITQTVEISDRCSVCDKERGKPTRKSFYEGGQTYSVDVWSNPCGHIDEYFDVIRDAKDCND